MPLCEFKDTLLYSSEFQESQRYIIDLISKKTTTKRNNNNKKNKQNEK